MASSKPEFSTFLEIFGETFENSVPFNKMIGMSFVELDEQNICVRVDMREELVGNFATGILHGGVIFSVMDSVGGAIAVVNLFRQLEDISVDERVKRLMRVGTIDMRVDFLRPGNGEHFLCTGSILRLGRRVAVSRMEMKNHEGTLIAVGTGTYSVG